MFRMEKQTEVGFWKNKQDVGIFLINEKFIDHTAAQRVPI